MQIAAVLFLMSGLVSVITSEEGPIYPQVRFQPLRNVVLLPSSEQLKELANNSTKEQETKSKDEKPEERKVVTMEELRRVEGAVAGSYHVLLENGKLQRVDYTAAPGLPVKEEVQQQPEIRSWYYTQIPADVLQRYYGEYYAQQNGNSQYRRPTSPNQASSSNSQGVSQSSSGNGFNQASNHNVQVLNQGKRGNFVQATHFESAASEQNFQRSGTAFLGSGPSQNSGSNLVNGASSEQRVASREEVETFEPQQRRKEEQGFPNGVVATIYYSDVSPITGPIYTFDQTPLIRILRQA